MSENTKIGLIIVTIIIFVQALGYFFSYSDQVKNNCAEGTSNYNDWKWCVIHHGVSPS